MQLCLFSPECGFDLKQTQCVVRTQTFTCQCSRGASWPVRLWTVLHSAILCVLTAQPHEGQSRVPARQITAPNQSDYPARADTPAHIWAACSNSLTRLVWQQRSQGSQLHRKSILSGDVGGSSPHLWLRDCGFKSRSARRKWSEVCVDGLFTCVQF